jgi:MoxR-like ATPase
MNEIRESFQSLMRATQEVIMGLEEQLQMVMASLLTGGHCLLEGMPGTGKTLLVKTLAHLCQAEFKRIQFTPDLMPSDIVGNMVYNMKEGAFNFKAGPIFAQFVLADEINRAPAKTQAALLEAMQERSVTIDGTRRELGPPFVVFATQNPIEQEGTYPLPEAELDRFMFKVVVDYPDEQSELAILRQHQRTAVGLASENSLPDPFLNPKDLVRMQESMMQVSIREELIGYLNNLVRKTRDHTSLVHGASPRAALMVLLASKAFAAFEGRDYVIPDDIKASFLPALRHRIILDPVVEVEDENPDSVLRDILNAVEVPK